ncbi:hypothetical protein V5F77_21170 [Xanthobacter sp. DSM 24535]|uniref:hypothetical protein n=1 Tax=Roseixanthobacter psychrophilus TaxID=3119917 RepID=UPI003727F8AD
MPSHSAAHAFLVRACLRTSSGATVLEPDTVCFDIDLALQMANDDRSFVAGVAIFALGEDGNLLSEFPLMTMGVDVSTPQPVTLAWSRPAGNENIVAA